jgi:glyoxylase-like metal-dependent hydrolase (beta-lactamase superfamily II)
MIKIQRFVCNMLQENCYVVSDDSGEAVVIDCGAYYESERQAIISYIDEQQLTLRHLICTHAHFDHCFGNATLWHRYDIKPVLPVGDEALADLDQQMRQMMGTGYTEEQAPIGAFYDVDATFDFGTHRLTVLATPGHSAGSCCLYCAEEHLLFTGDTLFCQSIGRTDFEGGSWTAMQQSLRMLATLPTDTRVLPGHGPETTIGRELQTNPYLQA